MSTSKLHYSKELVTFVNPLFTEVSKLAREFSGTNPNFLGISPVNEPNFYNHRQYDLLFHVPPSVHYTRFKAYGHPYSLNLPFPDMLFVIRVYLHGSVPGERDFIFKARFHHIEFVSSAFFDKFGKPNFNSKSSIQSFLPNLVQGQICLNFYHYSNSALDLIKAVDSLFQNFYNSTYNLDFISLISPSFLHIFTELSQNLHFESKAFNGIAEYLKTQKPNDFLYYYQKTEVWHDLRTLYGELSKNPDFWNRPYTGKTSALPTYFDSKVLYSRYSKFMKELKKL